jgi:hypothetical protein
MANIKNLAGQRFGRLVVLDRTDKRKGNCYLWRCQCDCGNTALITTYFLTHGLARSCGCLRKESRKVDITGQKFGKLTALKIVGRKRHGFLWLCQCDCGNYKNALTTNLLNGVTRSCGCLHEETAKINGKGMHKVNLRDGTNIARIQSEKIGRNNTSGVTGVSWHKARGMWRARITFKNITYNLGYFIDITKAAEARKAAELKYFGEYLKTINNRKTTNDND